ncbi:hypothetical protein PPERSA_08037 [Pseudocohnilembus persalinus]|uniref:Uncharacterized protein n=1 Tax=Pseudocohnilembus persalinus TaxID=266149 RepID=A0A0V0R2J1_PSEPJ|nr:hypothetical protein PPERSA_08037 [Pseudocohnilembus persalinus]|eukprot:KRX08726.1 hypothetical protein PPERSA_08037 [Pseudocohnilembus persalinus]
MTTKADRVKKYSMFEYEQKDKCTNKRQNDNFQHKILQNYDKNLNYRHKLSMDGKSRKNTDLNSNLSQYDSQNPTNATNSQSQNRKIIYSELTTSESLIKKKKKSHDILQKIQQASENSNQTTDNSDSTNEQYLQNGDSQNINNNLNFQLHQQNKQKQTKQQFSYSDPLEQNLSILIKSQKQMEQKNSIINIPDQLQKLNSYKNQNKLNQYKNNKQYSISDIKLTNFAESQILNNLYEQTNQNENQQLLSTSIQNQVFQKPNNEDFEFHSESRRNMLDQFDNLTENQDNYQFNNLFMQPIYIKNSINAIKNGASNYQKNTQNVINALSILKNKSRSLTVQQRTQKSAQLPQIQNLKPFESSNQKQQIPNQVFQRSVEQYIQNNQEENVSKIQSDNTDYKSKSQLYKKINQPVIQKMEQYEFLSHDTNQSKPLYDSLYQQNNDRYQIKNSQSYYYNLGNNMNQKYNSNVQNMKETNVNAQRFMYKFQQLQQQYNLNQKQQKKSNSITESKLFGSKENSFQKNPELFSPLKNIQQKYLKKKSGEESNSNKSFKQENQNFTQNITQSQIQNQQKLIYIDRKHQFLGQNQSEINEPSQQKIQKQFSTYLPTKIIIEKKKAKSEEKPENKININDKIQKKNSQQNQEHIMESQKSLGSEKQNLQQQKEDFSKFVQKKYQNQNKDNQRKRAQTQFDKNNDQNQIKSLKQLFPVQQQSNIQKYIETQN